MQPYRTMLTRTLLTLLTLSLAATAGAAGTAAGTSITNTGTLTYTTDDGVTSTTTSAVSATVAQVYSVSVTPDGTTGSPGQTVFTSGNTTGAQTTALTYTLTNPGNGTDSFNVTTSAVSANVTAVNVKYYADTNGNGSYDAGTDLIISAPISLAADATKVFFAVYTTPGNTAGTTNFDITPAATSVGDNTKTDTNNLGRITQKSLYDLTFTAPDSKSITTPGTAVYAQTLTNTGNMPLTAAQIVLSATPVDTVTGTGAFTQSYTVTIGAATTASFATPQAAINAALGAGTLPVGSFATLNTTVTANSTLSSGNKEVLTLGATITGVTNSSSANNNVPAAITVTDTSTVVKGLGTISKTQALCGTSGTTAPASCPASSGASSTALIVKPGDYVVYYLRATNTGSGNIFNTVISDPLPGVLSIYSIGSLSTQAGTVLFSTDNKVTWKTAALTTSIPNGTTLYAGVDTNSDGVITATDSMAAGTNLLLRVKMSVNGTVNTVPQADPQVVN